MADPKPVQPTTKVKKAKLSPSKAALRTAQAAAAETTASRIKTAKNAKATATRTRATSRATQVRGGPRGSGPGRVPAARAASGAGAGGSKQYGKVAGMSAQHLSTAMDVGTWGPDRNPLKRRK